MNTYVDLGMKIGGAAFLLPLAIYSIANGSVAPKGSWMEKYYGAEKNIGLVGNVFIVVLGIMCIADVAQYFGLIEETARNTVAHIMAIPFLVLCFAYIWLWVKAWRKIRTGSHEA